MATPVTPERLVTRHQLLFGEPPNPDQMRLFAAVPSIRGYSDRTLDEARFKAVVTLLTAQATTDRAILFAPSVHEKWVVAQFKAAADHIFNRAKTYDGNRVELARYYGKVFKNIFITSRMLQFNEAPKQWMAFGLDREDLIPEWVQAKLLAV
jgi:hypothetical protein